MKDDDFITLDAIAEQFKMKLECDPKLSNACIKISEFNQLKKVIDKSTDKRERFLAKEYILNRLLETIAISLRS